MKNVGVSGAHGFSTFQHYAWRGGHTAMGECALLFSVIRKLDTGIMLIMSKK